MKRLQITGLLLALLLVVLVVTSLGVEKLSSLNEADIELVSDQADQRGDRNGGCRWLDYYCNIFYYATIPSEEDGDPFAMRFTISDLCTLMTSEMTLYNAFEEFSDISGMGIDVMIWNDDGFGFPGDLVHTVNVPSAELVYSPSVLSIDVESAGLVFNDDFHIGFTTVDQVNDCYGILADDGTCGAMRSTHYYAGIWETMLDHMGQDINFLIAAEVCYESGACCDCDSLNDPYCFYTDRQVCADSNGTFYSGLTCDDVVCDTCYACGDINNDGLCLTVADQVFLSRFLFYGGAAPDPLYQADLNCDGVVDINDYYLYRDFFIYGLSVFTCGYPVPTICCPEIGTLYVPGDADGSSGVDIDDVVYLINYIFAGGPAPDPLETGDADCSDNVDIDDVVYLINYIFAGGPAPGDEC